MTIQRRALKTLALVVLMALIAAACGGGSDEEAAADSEGVEQPDVSFGGDDDVDPDAVATTAPLTVDTSDEDAEPAPTLPPAGDLDSDDPHEVKVLHVNDDVVLVPTFDAPNGSQTTLYDVNEIDGVELEYPLLADTAFGNRLALLVKEYDSTGNWAEVYFPVRPNGTTGWVQTAFFEEKTHNYHITIDVSDAMVRVFRGEEEILQDGQLAVMGQETRPTPIVRSYIDEKIPGEQLSPAYGTWVLSIAAFSEDLGTFGGGGMPKLAIHGTNQPELMGQYVSSGCVRIPNEIIDYIADTVPVGTIVDIVP